MPRVPTANTTAKTTSAGGRRPSSSGDSRRSGSDPGSEHQELKQILGDFISEAFIPKHIARRVEKSLAYRPDPRIMARAVKSTQDKVRRIIEHMDHINSRAFLLRIPGSEFLEFLLMSEYIVHNALAGERGVLRHLQQTSEPPSRTLTLCLNALGFHDPGDLRPFERMVRRRLQGGERLWRRLVSSLGRQVKEK